MKMDLYWDEFAEVGRVVAGQQLALKKILSYLETPNAPKFLPPQQKAPLPVICPEKGHSA